ncbi:MAG: site-specific DNA-methyltransferase [Chloroflexi bacterium]|nr:site-specific DNA-methyltransferase [Chloroflexota bacterium]
MSVLLPLIQAFSNPGDLILDPFAGSGSTGVAALKLGRWAHLVEQSPNYVRLAQERIGRIASA